MHLPRLRPRLRLRTLLIAVAVTGTALGGWQMWKRRGFCLARALRHQALSEFYGDGTLPVSDLETHNHFPSCVVDCFGCEAIRGRVSDRHRRLAARFLRVARYPWLPMPREAE